MEDDGDRAYADPKRKRDPGTGPVRLGTILELNEGQYSLMFVSAMHSDYIYYYTEVYGKEKDVAQAISAEKLKSQLRESTNKQQEKKEELKAEIGDDTSNKTIVVPKEAAETPIKEKESVL